MKLARVESQPRFYRTILVLVDEDSQRGLPFWFQNVQHLLQNRTQPSSQEPLTNDFLAAILQALGGSVELITIDLLQGSVPFAHVHIRARQQLHIIKARLEDALPLALHFHSPFAVAEELLETRGIPLETRGQGLERQLDALVADAQATGRPANLPLTRKIPTNLDFSQGMRGWSFMSNPIAPELSQCQIADVAGPAQKPALVITLKQAREEQQIENIALLIHEGFLAEEYRGQRLRARYYARTEEAVEASFRLNIYGPPIAGGMQKKTYAASTEAAPLEGTTGWTWSEIVMDVPEDALVISTQMNVHGQGQIWLSTVSFDEAGPEDELSDTRVTPPGDLPENLDFQRHFLHWHLEGNYPQDYRKTLHRDKNGVVMVHIQNSVARPRGLVTLKQRITTNRYQGQQVRLSAELKGEQIQQQGSLFLENGFVRKDRLEKNIESDSGWQRYSIPMLITTGNGQITFGLQLYGSGQIWLKNLRLEEISSQQNEEHREA